MELFIEFDLSEDVSDASKFSLAQQLAEILDEAMIDGSLQVNAGVIREARVAYDPELHF